jgi:hypothetical protein
MWTDAWKGSSGQSFYLLQMSAVVLERLFSAVLWAAVSGRLFNAMLSFVMDLNCCTWQVISAVLLFVMDMNRYTGQVVQCNVVICHGCGLLYWIGYQCRVVICHGCELLYWTGCWVQSCHLSWMWTVVLDKLFSAVLSFVINVSCCFGLLLNAMHSFYCTSCPSLFFSLKNITNHIMITGYHDTVSVVLIQHKQH